jgi:hypothetical protein
MRRGGCFLLGGLLLLLLHRGAVVGWGRRIALSSGRARRGRMGGGGGRARLRMRKAGLGVGVGVGVRLRLAGMVAMGIERVPTAVEIPALLAMLG